MDAEVYTLLLYSVSPMYIDIVNILIFLRHPSIIFEQGQQMPLYAYPSKLNLRLKPYW